jgi:cytochrome c peroxidase
VNVLAMKKRWIILFVVIVSSSFSLKTEITPYADLYFNSISNLNQQLVHLEEKIKSTSHLSEKEINDINDAVALTRSKLKAVDFWLRYLDPVVYKKINGPLPIEWENEVFEKFEKPYKREGAGLTLAYLYLNGKNPSEDSLARLIQLSIDAINTFKADSITTQLNTADHFFLCNRLFLLNLAAIYTTGFECPDNKSIIKELQAMLVDVNTIYKSYNISFPATALSKEYLELYDKAIEFTNQQPSDFTLFDHFSFLKDYVNPLFAVNQKMINEYNTSSKSYNDYTLNNNSFSIFDKALYTPQNSKGIYSLVEDPEALLKIRAVGKLLFNDPILSGNNERSCASCHKPTEYFADTVLKTSLQFDGKQSLPRNTPTLVDVIYNHLLMLDGRHISLQNQAKDVITNPKEMGGDEKEAVEKVLSCKEYRNTFKELLKYTPEEKEITFDHIVSAITYYYSDYSKYYAPFDEAMNNNKPLGDDAKHGFNLFMGKAQCGTCHYVPQFNGVPPPYISSEFEVLGVPEDTNYTKQSEDKGRYNVNPALETLSAFRTGSIRNAQYTKPYMHNGVFNTLDEVLDFYNAGGGLGRKLNVSNQTLSSDSLKLTISEKQELIAFIHSLNENIRFEDKPEKLPLSSRKELNKRIVDGKY